MTNQAEKIAVVLSEGERHRLRLLLEKNGTTDRQLRAHCKAHGGLRGTLLALLAKLDALPSAPVQGVRSADEVWLVQVGGTVLNYVARTEDEANEHIGPDVAQGFRAVRYVKLEAKALPVSAPDALGLAREIQEHLQAVGVPGDCGVEDLGHLDEAEKKARALVALLESAPSPSREVVRSERDAELCREFAVRLNRAHRERADKSSHSPLEPGLLWAIDFLAMSSAKGDAVVAEVDQRIEAAMLESAPAATEEDVERVAVAIHGASTVAWEAVKLTGNRLMARRLRQKVEAICSDRRGLKWQQVDPAVRRDLYKHVEREFLAVIEGRSTRFTFPYEVPTS